MIRLIASDMDDTLLNAHAEMTARTMRAVRRAMDAGVLFSLSSGRMPESMIPLAKKLDVNAPMILFNGGLIYDYRDDRTLFTNAIAADTALKVGAALEEMGIYYQAYPGKGFFCREKCERTYAYERSLRVQAQEVHMPLTQWMHSDMVKMLAIADPAVLDEAKPVLERRFPKGVHFMKSKAHYLEIVAENVDKGSALRVLGEKLGILPEEIMAFGDGQNDVTMLAAAGTGVAMENAVDECKRVSKLIAPHHDADGVAQVIERYLDEGLFGRG